MKKFIELILPYCTKLKIQDLSHFTYLSSLVKGIGKKYPKILLPKVLTKKAYGPLLLQF